MDAGFVTLPAQAQTTLLLKYSSAGAFPEGMHWSRVILILNCLMSLIENMEKKSGGM